MLNTAAGSNPNTPLVLVRACSVCLTLSPRGLQPARLLCPRDSPGKNTGVGCHFLLRGTFPTQGWNPCLLHWQVDSLPLSHLESTKYNSEVPTCFHQALRASLVAQKVKNLPTVQEDSIAGSGRSPGEGNGNPLQYSCLENSTDRPWGLQRNTTERLSEALKGLRSLRPRGSGFAASVYSRGCSRGRRSLYTPPPPQPRMGPVPLEED